MRTTIEEPEKGKVTYLVISNKDLEKLDNLLRPLGVQFVRYTNGAISAESLWPQEEK